MHPFRYGITLRLEHPAMDPELISSALEMKPFRQWRAGDRRTTRKGDPLEEVYRQTYWCSEGVRGEGKDLAQRLESELDKIEKKADFLAQFRSSGGEIELIIFWDTEEMNTGELFGWEILRRLSNLHINLGFDVYGGRNPGQRQKSVANREIPSQLQ